MMESAPEGAMLAVSMPENEVISLLNEDLQLAAVNSPSLCVVSGPKSVVADMRELIERKGTATRPLHTSHAFHSKMMDPIMEPFTELAGKNPNQSTADSLYFQFNRNLDHQCRNSRSWVLGETFTPNRSILGRNRNPF